MRQFEQPSPSSRSFVAFLASADARALKIHLKPSCKPAAQRACDQFWNSTPCAVSRSVQQFQEFRGGQVCLPEDGTKGAALDGAMLRNHDDPPIGTAVNGVAAFSPQVGESDGLQGPRDLANRQVRQGWAHAAPGSWNEVTRGVLVTNRAGSSTSSRYSSTASARLARASSIVGP